jgi:outer membrane receptor protein involved in Fe transport
MISPENIGPDFLLQEETLQSDAYDAALEVYAGYLSAEWVATSRHRVVAGVRYELAHQKLTPGTRFATNETPEPGSNRTDHDVLPGLNVTFALLPDMNLRAAYSYTLARPQSRELTPFNYFDFARRRSISGDPNLETTRIHNVDGRWEWFLAQDEVIAASVFWKQFDKPIERAVVTAAQGDLLYVNAPDATVIGTELEARVGLGRIAGFLRPLRAAGNVSLSRSEVDFGGAPGPQTSNRRPLQGQSPFVANASLTWDAPLGLELTALYNVQGRRLSDAGRNGQPDIYEQRFQRVDVALSRVFGESWKLKATASNLLDEEVVLKQADLVIQRYRPGVAGAVSLEWSH